MKLKKFRLLLLLTFITGLVLTIYTFNSPELVHAQQPTGSIPTVTGTPHGPTAIAKTGWTEKINVRNFPSSLENQSDVIGVISPSQQVNVIGKTIGGDWLLIEYPGVQGGEGWIWAPYMQITGGELPVVEIPPTPAPKVTATINPTLAAQFVITPNSTSLPTFTQPAPLNIPTYSTGASSTGNIPIGLVIIILVGLGAVIGLFSIFQSR
ncbi:MAG: SH3 domain-containing protein [Anaerolineaceae bacterium]